MTPDVREFVVMHRSESKDSGAPSTFAIVEQVAKILSLAAIPIVIAIIGSVLQNAVSQRSTQQEYVKIAVSILNSEDADPSLRAWAVTLLNENSPTKLDEVVSEKLRSGDVKLPNVFGHPDEPINVEPSENVTESVEIRLKRELKLYQEHFVSLGYEPTTSVTIKVTNDPGAMMIYYDPNSEKIVINGSNLNESDLIDMVLREYGHRVAASLQGRIFNSGFDPTYAVDAIESGMVTYFVCSYRGKPQFGSTDAPLRLDLLNRRRFSDIRANYSSASYDGSAVWGAAFWEVRSILGKTSADRLLFSALSEWKPAEGDDHALTFANKIIDIAKQNEGAEITQHIRRPFEARGLQFTP